MQGGAGTQGGPRRKQGTGSHWGARQPLWPWGSAHGHLAHPPPEPAQLLTQDFNSKEDGKHPAFRASAQSAARCHRGPCADRLAELGTGTAEGPAPPSLQHRLHAQRLGQTAHGREPVGLPPRSPPQGRRILRADSGVQLKMARGPALQKTQEAGRLTHSLGGSKPPQGGTSLAAQGLGRCVCMQGRGPISLGELRSHEPHSVVKIHLKCALQAHPAAHPPTRQTWAETYSVRNRLRKPRHLSAKGGPPAEAAPPARTAPDLTASQPGPPLWPQDLSQQNFSPPPILEDQQLHGMHVTPGRHRTPPVPADKATAQRTQRQGKGTSHTGRSPHRTWPGAWDCRHSSNGHRAQEAAGGQSRPAVSPLAPGCPGFSSAAPKRPAPLSWGLTGRLPAAPRGF